MSFFRRNRELVLLAILMVVALVFSIAMMARNDFLTNVGFLVLGSLLAIFTTLLSEAIKRPARARDLARALYEELADRVARCCFDYEAPWSEYLDKNNYDSAFKTMGTFRLRKFSPGPPIIYSSTASQLAILENDAPQALIKFYFRLAAWQRDIENVAAECQQNKDGVDLRAVVVLAKRLQQTLTPGLKALEALAPLVEEHQKIEAAAIAGYDETRKDVQAKGTLRERIMKLVG